MGMYAHETHDAFERSGQDDSAAISKWIPIVVPAAAVAFATLIFAIAWEVLSRP